MRQKDEMERTENARARSNRHILWLTYGIAALFIAMAVYFGWFIQFKSENVIGSSYNARLDLLSDRVTRGSIMSNDKTVLAQTNVASDGSEKRYYPYDYLFVHSVGYSGKNGKTGLESLANFYLLSSHVNLIEKNDQMIQICRGKGKKIPWGPDKCNWIIGTFIRTCVRESWLDTSGNGHERSRSADRVTKPRVR